MNPLSLADRRHIEAAKGWCELHAFNEANSELDEVTAEYRAHPDVLEVRWQVYANLENWEGALELANALARLLPGKPEGYIYTASSLHELGRWEEAHLVLLQAQNCFPRDEIILYDLACVCCLLDRIQEAKTWLGMAIDVGGNAIRKRALDDSDLEPLWQSEA